MNTQREIGNDTNNASARYHVINPSKCIWPKHIVSVIRLLIYRWHVGRIRCNLVFDTKQSLLTRCLYLMTQMMTSFAAMRRFTSSVSVSSLARGKITWNQPTSSAIVRCPKRSVHKQLLECRNNVRYMPMPGTSEPPTRLQRSLSVIPCYCSLVQQDMGWDLFSYFWSKKKWP